MAASVLATVSATAFDAAAWKTFSTPTGTLVGELSPTISKSMGFPPNFAAAVTADCVAGGVSPSGVKGSDRTKVEAKRLTLLATEVLAGCRAHRAYLQEAKESISGLQRNLIVRPCGDESDWHTNLSGIVPLYLYCGIVDPWQLTDPSH